VGYVGAFQFFHIGGKSKNGKALVDSTTPLVGESAVGYSQNVGVQRFESRLREW